MRTSAIRQLSKAMETREITPGYVPPVPPTAVSTHRFPISTAKKCKPATQAGYHSGRGSIMRKTQRPGTTANGTQRLLPILAERTHMGLESAPRANTKQVRLFTEQTFQKRTPRAAPQPRDG